MSEAITRRSVLEECLKEKARFLLMVSKDNQGLRPQEGYEKEYETMWKKCEILRQVIQDYENPEVQAVAAKWRDPAKWQREVMEHGPAALEIGAATPGKDEEKKNESEPLKPLTVGKNRLGITMYRCRWCGLDIVVTDRYCRECGREIKWEFG